MKPRLMEYVWIGAALGLALYLWEKHRTSGASQSTPPASQLYHPVNNPNGYVYVNGQWIAANPGNGDAALYDPNFFV